MTKFKQSQHQNPNTTPKPARIQSSQAGSSPLPLFLQLKYWFQINDDTPEEEMTHLLNKIQKFRRGNLTNYCVGRIFHSPLSDEYQQQGAKGIHKYLMDCAQMRSDMNILALDHPDAHSLMGPREIGKLGRQYIQRLIKRTRYLEFFAQELDEWLEKKEVELNPSEKCLTSYKELLTKMWQHPDHVERRLDKQMSKFQTSPYPECLYDNDNVEHALLNKLDSLFLKGSGSKNSRTTLDQEDLAPLKINFDF